MSCLSIVVRRSHLISRNPYYKLIVCSKSFRDNSAKKINWTFYSSFMFYVLIAIWTVFQEYIPSFLLSTLLLSLLLFSNNLNKMTLKVYFYWAFFPHPKRLKYDEWHLVHRFSRFLEQLDHKFDSLPKHQEDKEQSNLEFNKEKKCIWANNTLHLDRPAVLLIYTGVHTFTQSIKFSTLWTNIGNFDI